MSHTVIIDRDENAPGLDPSLITYTNIIYGLHALSVMLGIITTATIVGNFIFGIPSIVAVIMNFVRRSEVRGTFLDSHFRWQIRTFFFAAFWTVLVASISIPLTLILVGFATWAIGFLCIGSWIIYRVAKGWLALKNRAAMYV